MGELELLRAENKQLKKALKTTLWMATEYAKDAKFFAPYLVNRALDMALDAGVHFPPSTRYVNDPLLGVWNPAVGYFEWPKLPQAQPPGQLRQPTQPTQSPAQPGSTQPAQPQQEPTQP